MFLSKKKKKLVHYCDKYLTVMLLAIWKRKNDKNTRMKEKFTSRVYAHKKVHLRIETGGQESDGGKTVSHIHTQTYERDEKKGGVSRVHVMVSFTCGENTICSLRRRENTR